MSNIHDAATEPILRLGFVPGVVPFKWVSRFKGQFGEAALSTGRILPDDAAAALLANELDAALMPVPVDKDVFHAIPLYTETDEEKGRVWGREIGLVWSKDLEHPLIEPLAGIVRGRTANSSRGSTASDQNAKSAQSDAPGQGGPAPSGSKNGNGPSRAKPKTRGAKANTRGAKPRGGATPGKSDNGKSDNGKRDKGKSEGKNNGNRLRQRRSK